MSKLLLWDFLGEPLDSPRRLQRTFSGGIWRLGVAPRRVRIVLLDNRHARDPYGGRGQDMLGEEQWAWLEAELRDGEPAEVTVIGAGLQVGGSAEARGLRG